MPGDITPDTGQALDNETRPPSVPGTTHEPPSMPSSNASSDTPTDTGPDPQQPPRSTNTVRSANPGTEPSPEPPSASNRLGSVFERFMLNIRRFHHARLAVLNETGQAIANHDSAPAPAQEAPSTDGSPAPDLLDLTGEHSRTILITLNYLFSDQNDPQNPNRLGSLIISIPNNAANREPGTIQDFVRFATRVAYSGIISNLNKKRGVSREAYELFPLLSEVGECTECPICFELFNMDHITTAEHKISGESEPDRNTGDDLLRKRRKLSPDRLTGELNYSTPVESPLVGAETPVPSEPASPSSFAPPLPGAFVAPDLYRSSSVPNVLRNAPLAANIPRAGAALPLRSNENAVERSSADGESNPHLTAHAPDGPTSGDGQDQAQDGAHGADPDGEQHVEYKHAPVKMPCGHIFGRNCLYEWLKDHLSCPLCRVQIPALAQAPAAQNTNDGLAHFLHSEFNTANIDPTEPSPEIRYYTITTPVPDPSGESTGTAPAPVPALNPAPNPFLDPATLRTHAIFDVLPLLRNGRPDQGPPPHPPTSFPLTISEVLESFRRAQESSGPTSESSNSSHSPALGALATSDALQALRHRQLELDPSSDSFTLEVGTIAGALRSLDHQQQRLSVSSNPLEAVPQAITEVLESLQRERQNPNPSSESPDLALLAISDALQALRRRQNSLDPSSESFTLDVRGIADALQSLRPPPQRPNLSFNSPASEDADSQQDTATSNLFHSLHHAQQNSVFLNPLGVFSFNPPPLANEYGAASAAEPPNHNGDAEHPLSEPGTSTSGSVDADHTNATDALRGSSLA